MVNTILRNLNLPRIASETNCTSPILFTVKDGSVTYAMAQREWMQTFLPTALTPTTFRIDLLTNTTTATTTGFQTNASHVADLLALQPTWVLSIRPSVTAMRMEINVFPPPDSPGYCLPIQLPVKSTIESGFLQTYQPLFDATVPLNWTLGVSPVQITQDIWMDAITMELMLRPSISNTATFSTTMGHAIFGGNDTYPDAQIHAYAVCVNKNNTETLMSVLAPGQYPTASIIDCQKKSSNSMYVFSSGRHFVADNLNADDDALNLRVVYSATFARLS